MSRLHLADRVDADDDEAIDQLFEELENDDFGKSVYREQRLREFQNQVGELKEMKENSHGTYVEVTEKDVIDATTNSKYCIVHFFSDNFERCKIMDKHLEKLAKKHFRVKVIKANAENCPFLVAKLKIKVLPFVIAFIDGQVVERLVGFELLGNVDDFKTEKLEKIFVRAGILRDSSKPIKEINDEEYSGRRSIRSGNLNQRFD